MNHRGLISVKVILIGITLFCFVALLSCGGQKEPLPDVKEAHRQALKFVSASAKLSGLTPIFPKGYFVKFYKPDLCVVGSFVDTEETLNANQTLFWSATMKYGKDGVFQLKKITFVEQSTN